MKIIVLKYGESVFEENHIFKGGKEDRLLPISFVIYLIQTESRNILVDVGCDDGAGFPMSIFDKPVNILKDYGLEPYDITDVVITHNHHDHIEAIKYYQNAVIHIQNDEYETGGKKYIPENFRVNLFEEEYEIEDGITIKKIGGHSIGSCVVIVESELKYLFCGDECYYEKCLTEKIPTGSSYRNDISEKFINQYGGRNYIPLLFHDPDIMCGRKGAFIVETNV